MKKKPVKFRNPRTKELWICENEKNRRVVDGVAFVQVHRPDSTHLVWINMNHVKREREVVRKR